MNNTATKKAICRLAAVWPPVMSLLFGVGPLARADDPAKGDTMQVDLGGDVAIELVYIPPGRFMMGTTPEERAWAVGPEGRAAPGRGGDGREICLDHWDPKGAHEDVCLDDTPRRVCRGVSYLAIPGFSRCAVRLGLRGPGYSDSRDGFRLCLGVPRGDASATPGSRGQ